MCFGVSKVCHFFLLFFFFQRLYIIYKNVNQIIVGDDSFFWIESNNFQSICFGYRKILIFFFFFSFLFKYRQWRTLQTQHRISGQSLGICFNRVNLCSFEIFFPTILFLFLIIFFNVVPCYTSHWQQPVTSLIDCQFHPPHFFF